MSELRPQSYREGCARVFLGEEPERGAHPGIRGYIVADALGVHVGPEAEWLTVESDSADGWPMGDWSEGERASTIPWHRIDVIEWEPESDA